jgi:hypothetical protein
VTKETLAAIIAAYLDCRDDVASATTGPVNTESASIVYVVTQGEEHYRMEVEYA